MLLFQKRFHEGLRNGDVTLTFRLWPRARVKPGGRYRCHPIGVVEVDFIERVQVGSITEADARRAGFQDRTALIHYLSGIGPVEDSTGVFRLGIHFGGDGDRVPAALDPNLSPEDVQAISARLAKMDARSAHAWTEATLSIIAQSPRVAASKLAARLGRDTPSFKADVVRLKKLGLTQSFEVGYEISPRGVSYMKRVKRNSRHR